MNKALAGIQILIFLSLTLCSSGVTFVSQGKSGEFPCKGHTCGCKSEADCKAHCCCLPQGNQSTSQHGVKKQKNSFQSFISSLTCKSGSDPITCINAELKYILEDYCVIPQITFFCFLASDTLVHRCEPMVSPPEKPPRCHA
ncbi:MAG: hypothetical protein CV087_08495 [Candidatus Brocadia sp. WS118]|nr:MAG: hypothetical protein CV087_08495 [Candidatus Brocadia sp. WS118]